MKRIQRFVVFALLFSFVLVGIFTVNVAQAAKLPKGTAVAGISVEGLSDDEAKNKVIQAVQNWQANGAVTLRSSNETFLISRTSFQFDINKTLKELKEKTKRRWYRFFLKPKNVRVSLHVTLNEKDGIVWPDYVDKKATIEEAIQIARELGDREGKIVYKDNQTPNPTKIADIHFPIPSNLSDTVLKNLIMKMNNLQIEPQTDFSLIEHVLEPLNMTKSSEETSFIASALYALTLQTNIEIIERHSQGKIPSYTQAGVEAEVNRAEKKDLKLHNPNLYSYIVKAEKRDGRLVMSLHIPEQAASYKYRVENVKEIKPQVVYRYSSKLSPGEKQTIQSGSKGLKVEVYREEVSDSGSVENVELISRDYYPPRPTIILASSLSSNASNDSPAPEQQVTEQDGSEYTGEKTVEDSILRDVRNDIDELYKLIPTLRPNPKEKQTKTNDDPFEAIEELQQQFYELFMLIQLLSILFNMDDMQCEMFDDEETRALCEEMKDDDPFFDDQTSFPYTAFPQWGEMNERDKKTVR